jgi:hypothetical protein
MTSDDLTIEPTGAKELEPCPCCGNTTRRVWGFAHRGARTEAAYFVEWISGAVRRHGATFDLIVGQWGDGATAADRIAVTVAFRQTVRGPEFMVIDSGHRPHAESELVGRALDRRDVLETPVATCAFAIVDAIWLQDDRIRELQVSAA